MKKKCRIQKYELIDAQKSNLCVKKSSFDNTLSTENDKAASKPPISHF